MEMLKRNRRDLLKNAAAVATASLASNVWTSVSAVALGRKVGAIARRLQINLYASVAESSVGPYVA